MTITVALIGNPNVGKTEVFNRLTGARQHIGNWPGVTVEKRTGTCIYKNEKLEIVDLPGSYSLTSGSIDEIIARDFIIENKPEVVVDIVDASNLERNLYLTFLLLELEANVVIALNMWDVSKARGDSMDVDKLSELLGVPVVPTVAPSGDGLDELKEEVLRAAKAKKGRRIKIGYGEDLENLIENVEDAIKKDEILSSKYPTRWLAIRVLERDEDVLAKIRKSSHADEILSAIK